MDYSSAQFFFSILVCNQRRKKIPHLEIIHSSNSTFVFIKRLVFRLMNVYLRQIIHCFGFAFIHAPKSICSPFKTAVCAKDHEISVYFDCICRWVQMFVVYQCCEMCAMGILRLKLWRLFFEFTMNISTASNQRFHSRHMEVLNKCSLSILLSIFP